MPRLLSFANPRFILSAVRAADFPRQPAVAFAGRSNAGKSSAINALCGGRFARVSATPGRTRAVNIFAVGPQSRPRLLADLPGYGYAAASKKERAAISRIVQSFLRDGAICGMVLIADCRRGIGEMDAKLIRQVIPKKIPLMVALSKCDKLRRGALARAVADAQKRLTEMRAENAVVIPFSAFQKTGAPKLRAEIAAALLSPATDADGE